ncbi:serine protease [Actinacidiphila sp. ITFR-21]|uniref:serine protease n=1 Tax=Actinacidiphila sp. ITFR-21 TaxID=3075199 RepID=UPI00288C025C|nr:serine protease [Streptomyces sp. ITFR-21]WNI18350.1 serine protease [Streptomyces sp. ITFR-21]
MAARGSERDNALVRVCDLAGRPRGTGFLADLDGTVITSHEAVDGLARLVLHAPGDQVCLVEADAITPLPGYGVALVATEGLTLPALPVATHGPAHPDRRIRLRLPYRAEGSVVGPTAVTSTACDRFPFLDEVYELALDGADLNRAGAQTSGAPLIDAATGAVLAVVVASVATAPRAGHRASGFAVPLRTANAPGPLAEVLARNAATVPAHGAHLNLAGALRLTGVTVGSAAVPGEWREPLPRPELADAVQEFLAAPAQAAPLLLGLVGDPGTGRSTELARLAARRARGAHPAPTLWLRGAELRPGDGGIKDAVERALHTAARIADAASDRSHEPLHAAADAVAGLARAAGRPLLVILDAPEEMPPVLAHALPGWTAATAGWLRTSGARLAVACRGELWEQLAASTPPGASCRVPVGALTGEQAVRARERYGLPAGSLAAADAAHPLALRLLSEVRAALPADAAAGEPPTRAEIFSAHLDLVCLRTAVRLAAAAQPAVRGSAVRRLAARVAGQAHEAARRCLGPGQGRLDREAFEELFPSRTGWASAVLAEGLLVPAGTGYRFAHEEVADWLQSLHLDLGTALHALIHRWFAPSGALPEAPVRLPSRPAARAGHLPPASPVPPVAPAGHPRGLPVPRHRAGPVRQALLAAPPAARAAHLHHLLQVLDRRTPFPARFAAPLPPAAPAQEQDREADTVPIPHPGARRAAGAARPGRRPPDPRVPRVPRQAGADRAERLRPAGTTAPHPGRPAGAVGADADRAGPSGPAERRADALWWATHLVRETLTRAPDPDVLRELAGRVVVRAVARGGFTADAMGPLGHFGPAFWTALPLPVADRLDLLRLLLPADPPPGGPGPRFLTAAADLLRARPAEAMPALSAWFGDDRPLRTGTGPDTPCLTVTSAAQALLHTYRHLALDDLTEVLVSAGHPAADQVLAELADEEPSAVCRAVDRWAHDARPGRRVAAAAYGLRAAAPARTAADRELLRCAALEILARPQDGAVHGAALGILLRDPATRDRHLPAALPRFAAGDPHLTPAVLGAALSTHPEPVLRAFQARLREADAPGAADVVAELAAADAPTFARRAAALVADHLRRRPEAAPDTARFLDARLERGPGARGVLLPLVADLLLAHPPQVRRVLVPVFAAPGTPPSRPLRQELLDLALDAERDPVVLDALLTAAAEGCRGRHPLLTRDLVHRLGLLLGRRPEGAAHFDRRVVELAVAEPAFARLLREWLADGGSWDAVVGPSARRRLATVA